MGWFWLIAVIALWGAVHSWLASLPVKAFVRNRLGATASCAYRLAYNGLSMLTFMPIVILARVLPDQWLYGVPAPWSYLMLAGQVSAILVLVVVLLQTDPLSFIGLRQMFEGERASGLVTNGFYRWVRHPLYLFGLLVLWLTPVMTLNMLVAFLSMTAYLLVGAAFEERKLMHEFGAAYADYRARTPMIIPLTPTRGGRASDRKS